MTASGPRPGRAARISTLASEAVGIVGHGPFATALASLLTAGDLTAVVWTDDDDVRTEINRDHRRACLPGVTLGRKVIATADPAELAELCRVVVLAVSSRGVEDALARLDDQLDERHTVAHAIGALADGDRRVSQVVRARTRVTRVAALAGPTLPGDLIARRSSALVVAAEQPEALEAVKRVLHQPPVLRIYQSRDLIGVELASALAGALTVVLGMAEGSGAPPVNRTVLATRAVAEMATLVAAAGGDLRTAYGMAGLGTLLARTAAGAERSREYELGVACGRGERVDGGPIAGARALATGRRLARLLGVAAPIFDTAGELLAGRLDVDEATERLTSWEPGAE